MIKRLTEYVKKCNNIIALTLGEFELQKTLGQGGNGIVYSGKILDKNIALKFLTSDATGNTLETKTKRFLAEYFNIITIKNSEGIVKYIDYDTLKFSDSEGEVIVSVILMKEYKSSLSNISPVKTKEEFLNIFNFLIDTVEKIHNCGIIHRDLKPENILVDDDNYVLADFGIASYNPEIFSFRAETGKKERIGNRLFSAPEQETSGIDAHPTMDIYAIGQIMHWLIFSETHRGTNRKQIFNVFPDLGKYDYIIERCLSNDYQNRYQSINEIREHLKNLFSREKDIWQYIDKFGNILAENYPKNEFGIIHSNNLKRIDKLFQSLKNSEEEFENHLWWHNGSSNIDFKLSQKEEGVWHLNQREISIEEIWIHYDLSFFNDFIIVHFKKGKPFIIGGKEQYYNIFVDDKYEITYSEYENRRAEINDEIINLNEHKVEFIERAKEEGFLIISTRFHCALQTANDKTVREFMERLKSTNGKIDLEEFHEFELKIRVHKHSKVIMDL
ncbi:MAG: protein kinase [Bacteroidia bacterium]|nr:protein kinase [Bacteroidia bacterium]